MRLVVHVVLTSMGNSHAMHDVMLVRAYVDAGLYIAGRSIGKDGNHLGFIFNCKSCAFLNRKVVQKRQLSLTENKYQSLTQLWFP